jgi:FKBP-type peptidyl-prolyl cis-trans isomerase
LRIDDARARLRAFMKSTGMMCDLALVARLALLILTPACSSGLSNAPPPPVAPESAEEAEEAPAPPPPAPEPPPASAAAEEPLLVLPSSADLAPARAPDPRAPADLKAPPPDAKKTSTGLVSKVLSKGTGSEHPSGDDTVVVRHTGWMTSGVKFESSADSGKPADYVLSRAMPGWVEGLPLMVTGEKRRFWIPGTLAYGDTPRPYGQAYGPLVYDIELVAIKHPPRAPAVPDDLTSPPSDAKRTASGLVYKVMVEGSGKVRPGPRSTVEVNYSGWTLDGQLFDSSVARGETATFPLNGVIKGWTEALALMVVGDKARVWIPANLAYGERPKGGSPAGALVFDIELVAIKDARR